MRRIFFLLALIFALEIAFSEIDIQAVALRKSGSNYYLWVKAKVTYSGTYDSTWIEVGSKSSTCYSSVSSGSASVYCSITLSSLPTSFTIKNKYYTYNYEEFSRGCPDSWDFVKCTYDFRYRHVDYVYKLFKGCVPAKYCDTGDNCPSGKGVISYSRDTCEEYEQNEGKWIEVGSDRYCCTDDGKCCRDSGWVRCGGKKEKKVTNVKWYCRKKVYHTQSKPVNLGYSVSYPLKISYYSQGKVFSYPGGCPSGTTFKYCTYTRKEWVQTVFGESCMRTTQGRSSKEDKCNYYESVEGQAIRDGTGYCGWFMGDKYYKYLDVTWYCEDKNVYVVTDEWDVDSDGRSEFVLIGIEISSYYNGRPVGTTDGMPINSFVYVQYGGSMETLSNMYIYQSDPDHPVKVAIDSNTHKYCIAGYGRKINSNDSIIRENIPCCSGNKVFSPDGNWFSCCREGYCFDESRCVPDKTNVVVNGQEKVCVGALGEWMPKRNCYYETGHYCTTTYTIQIYDDNYVCTNDLTNYVGKTCYKEDVTCIEGKVARDPWYNIFNSKEFECSPGCWFNNTVYQSGSAINISYTMDGKQETWLGETVYHLYYCVDYKWVDPDTSQTACENLRNLGYDTHWTGSYCCGDDTNESYVCGNGGCTCVPKGYCNASVYSFWNNNDYYIYPYHPNALYRYGDYFYLCKKSNEDQKFCDSITFYYCMDNSEFSTISLDYEYIISVAGKDRLICSPDLFVRSYEGKYFKTNYSMVLLSSNRTVNVGDVLTYSGGTYPISGDILSRNVLIRDVENNEPFYLNYSQIYWTYSYVNNRTECCGNSENERILVRYCAREYSCSTNFTDAVCVDKNDYYSGVCVMNGTVYENGSMTSTWYNHTMFLHTQKEKYTFLYAIYDVPVYRDGDLGKLDIVDNGDGTVNIMYSEMRKVPIMCLNGTWVGTCGDGICGKDEDIFNCPEDCCKDCKDVRTGEVTKYCIGYDGCVMYDKCVNNQFGSYCLDNETMLICPNTIKRCDEMVFNQFLNKYFMGSMFSSYVYPIFKEIKESISIESKCVNNNCELTGFSFDADKNRELCLLLNGYYYYDPIQKENLCCGDDINEYLLREKFMDIFGPVVFENRMVCSNYLGDCVLFVESNGEEKILRIPEGVSVEIFVESKDDNCDLTSLYNSWEAMIANRTVRLVKIQGEFNKCINTSKYFDCLAQAMDACTENQATDCITFMSMNISPSNLTSCYGNDRKVTYKIKIGGVTYDFPEEDLLLVSSTFLVPGNYTCENGWLVLKNVGVEGFDVGNITLGDISVPMKLSFLWRNSIVVGEGSTLAGEFHFNYTQADIQKYEEILNKNRG